MRTNEWLWKGQSKLHPYARCIYAALVAFRSSKSGTAFPSIETLADALNLNESTVRRHLRQLVAEGLVVEVARRKNSSTVYRVEVHDEMPEWLALPADEIEARRVRREKAQERREKSRKSSRDGERPGGPRRAESPPNEVRRAGSPGDDREEIDGNTMNRLSARSGPGSLPGWNALSASANWAESPPNPDHLTRTTEPGPEVTPADADAPASEIEVLYAELIESAPVSVSSGWGADAPADGDELEDTTVSEADDEIETAEPDDEPEDELTEDDIGLVNAKYWAMKEWATTQGPEKFDPWMRVQRFTAENKIRDARLEPQQVDHLSPYARSIFGRAAINAATEKEQP